MCSQFTLAQIGVNTPDPKSTFDITAKASTGKSNVPEGLLVPRVDRERAQSMIGTAISTLIYVNDISTGLQTGTAINIDAVGYYYFDGRFWIKLNNDSAISPMVNIYNTNGELTSNRTVEQKDKNIIFNSTSGNFQVLGNNNTLTRSFFKNTNTGSTSRMDLNVGAGSSNIYLGIDNGSGIFGADAKGYLDNRTGGRFVIGTAGVEHLTVDKTGNIGIRTSAPATPLDILTGRGYGLQHSDGNIKLRTFLGANAANGNVQAGWIGTSSNHSLDLMTNDLPRIRVSETGNVGIGTSTPQIKLDVNGGVAIDAATTASTTKNVLDINMGRDGYAYGNRGNDFGINMKTSSSVHAGNVARINFGDIGTSANVGNRYLSFSVGKTLKEVMYIDDVNDGRVGIGTSNPSSSAILELSSTNQGFLPPRLTTAQRDAIPAANRPAGLMIYNTNTNCLNFWNSSEWVSTCGGSTPVAGSITGITCTSATNSGNLYAGSPASGVISTIPYTGGNGGSHGGQTVSSTGVTGLTATLSAGSFANGNGSISYSISGTPSAVGTASFAINIGGRVCTLTRTVAEVPPPTPDLSKSCTGSLLPLGALGVTKNFTVDGKAMQISWSSYNNVRTSSAINGSCDLNLESSSYSYFLGSNGSGGDQASSYTVKFTRAVSNLKVTQIRTSIGENFTYTFKRGGVVVKPNVTFSNQYGCVGGFKSTSSGDNTIIENSSSDDSYSSTLYNFGGVWFDEMIVSTPGTRAGSMFNYCVGAAK
ncbi:hypothetical protein [Chryseobacterium sp. MMS23-Vi53]|uniref:hypothetical protein n=1 Tax=Chryseobacterium sp. MMS23-Vi53 TaxID=3386644 RepID=UPI0039E8A1CA